MNEQTNNIEEQEIDLIKLVSDLWARRKFIFKSVGVGIVVGLIVAFSIPKEYTASAKLAPEMQSGASKVGSLGGLAAMAGISLGSSGGGDAISATLYPDVVGSVPFVTELFPIPVVYDEQGSQTSLYNYIDKELKAPWWGYILSAPFKLLGVVMDLFSGDETEVVSSGDNVDVKALTEDQFKIYEALKERISVSVDTKTFVISVSVTMQDPKIAANIAQIVVDNMLLYVTEYRTQKVKNDLKYAKTVFLEARDKYHATQQAYATFEDENKNITSSRYRTELERLRNDMNLAFSLFTNLATNLEQTRLKVQEQTPVCVTIEPVTRPIRRSSPNKPMILIAFTFLAGVVSAGYLVFRDKLIEF